MCHCCGNHDANSREVGGHTLCPRCIKQLKASAKKLLGISSLKRVTDRDIIAIFDRLWVAA